MPLDDTPLFGTFTFSTQHFDEQALRNALRINEVTPYSGCSFCECMHDWTQHNVIMPHGCLMPDCKCIRYRTISDIPDIFTFGLSDWCNESKTFRKIKEAEKVRTMKPEEKGEFTTQTYSTLFTNPIMPNDEEYKIEEYEGKAIMYDREAIDKIQEENKQLKLENKYLRKANKNLLEMVNAFQEFMRERK